VSRPPKPPNTKIESEDWENIRFVDADKEGERERDNMTYTCRRRTDKRVMSTGGRRNRLATAGTGACVGGGGGFSEGGESESMEDTITGIYDGNAFRKNMRVRILTHPQKKQDETASIPTLFWWRSRREVGRALLRRAKWWEMRKGGSLVDVRLLVMEQMRVSAEGRAGEEGAAALWILVAQWRAALS
jgi:hypothetical protein